VCVCVCLGGLGRLCVGLFVLVSRRVCAC
jgi:hypothetical protein